MDDFRSIGQLARAASVPVSTVRYYERRGLVRPERRSRGNFRLYGKGALERLRFVRSAQAAGFTLSDIGKLLEFRDGDPAPCREVQALIVARLDTVGVQVEQLLDIRKMLRRWLRVCREAEHGGRCGVLEVLCGCEERRPGKPPEGP